ncbi:hypothetical protein NDU88_006278 [Pleurodeles waltl]|uniref:Uncharacterized protein n=1 Tax=Pleurodeles waltl TaxID=8319 RepID=A0AAV7VQB0_PLEWA|nr:hypothetical protein NDU88_006278 [Pleurodeles waltl]
MAPLSATSRTPPKCSMLPCGLNPLTGGAGTSKSNIRKRARIQNPKRQPQFVRSRGSIMYAARPRADRL